MKHLRLPRTEDCENYFIIKIDVASYTFRFVFALVSLLLNEVFYFSHKIEFLAKSSSNN